MNSSRSPAVRVADPYRDVAVIDARAPRLSQLVIGSLAAAALLTRAWPLLTLGALQLTLTRRLSSEGQAPVLVAVSRRPDLARKYGVAVVPLAVGRGPGREVQRRIH
jgi:hypothetical protein